MTHYNPASDILNSAFNRSATADILVTFYGRSDYTRYTIAMLNALKDDPHVADISDGETGEIIWSRYPSKYREYAFNDMEDYAAMDILIRPITIEEAAIIVEDYRDMGITLDKWLYMYAWNDIVGGAA